MTTETTSQPIVTDLFHYNRRKTRTVFVGSVGVGGENPIRLQSMTTTPTTQVEATVRQAVRMIEAGCEIVRITAPTVADARALGPIRASLNALGFSKIPLVADIHFNPECAIEAANHVEKVRVNPGNYADSKIFKTKEYSDAEYAAELTRIEERFTPLVLKCKALKRAMRIGCNHGSLSDRIMNRYGDSPEGMVESALEFVRIAQKNQYFDLILSMKSSNPKVMIAAYRLLVASMAAEGMDYPLHLGVTEAGYGEDGRIKSAIGIGSLLNDGIGDTIRVSLTEDPEFEIPVAMRLAAPYQPQSGDEAMERYGDAVTSSPDRGIASSLPALTHVDNFYHYARRQTNEVTLGPFKLGGENVVRVANDFSRWLARDSAPKDKALKLLNLVEEQLAAGKGLVPEMLDWPINSHQDLESLAACRRALGGERSTLAFIGRFNDLTLARAGLSAVHAAIFKASPTLSAAEQNVHFEQFLKAAADAKSTVVIEAGPNHRGRLVPADELVQQATMCAGAGLQNVLLSFDLSTPQDLIANTRLAVAQLRAAGLKYPFHLRMPGFENQDDQRLRVAVAFGSLFCDGIGDSVQCGLGAEPHEDLSLVYNVLQGAGVRITKTEFVSCPSCGRTLFDLQSTTERIKDQTGHLKGVKIAIMGCIVNGPGEMADADFGYVGGATGKINLYVGKTCVEKGIPFEQADERLIELIKAHGKWADAK